MNVNVKLFSIYLWSQTGLFFLNNQQLQKLRSAKISFKDIPVFSLLPARFYKRISWDFADAVQGGLRYSRDDMGHASNPMK